MKDVMNDVFFKVCENVHGSGNPSFTSNFTLFQTFLQWQGLRIGGKLNTLENSSRPKAIFSSEAVV